MNLQELITEVKTLELYIVENRDKTDGMAAIEAWVKIWGFRLKLEERTKKGIGHDLKK